MRTGTARLILLNRRTKVRPGADLCLLLAALRQICGKSVGRRLAIDRRLRHQSAGGIGEGRPDGGFGSKARTTKQRRGISAACCHAGRAVAGARRHRAPGHRDLSPPCRRDEVDRVLPGRSRGVGARTRRPGDSGSRHRPPARFPSVAGSPDRTARPPVSGRRASLPSLFTVRVRRARELPYPPPRRAVHRTRTPV